MVRTSRKIKIKYQKIQEIWSSFDCGAILAAVMGYFIIEYQYYVSLAQKFVVLIKFYQNKSSLSISRFSKMGCDRFYQTHESHFMFQVHLVSILLFKGLPPFGFLIFQFKNTPISLYLCIDKIKGQSGKNATLTPTKTLPKNWISFLLIFKLLYPLINQIVKIKIIYIK